MPYQRRHKTGPGRLRPGADEAPCAGDRVHDRPRLRRGGGCGRAARRSGICTRAPAPGRGRDGAALMAGPRPDVDITANFADLVGNTPLVRLTRVAREV